ncbi:MAG: glycosyltransferase family 2 protein [Candidatus Omnitrophica bacterium]|nr:glycosyltransferase family 2 protein [Candidatus Omnitrophota bacterium]
MSKLISIIIPTYNRAAMIKRAIESVLVQDYDNMEVIVVDDASKDNTPEVVRSVEDPRLIYIRRPENKGAAAARNTGMRQATGEYIAFLDSDDEYIPGKLGEQVKAFEKLDPVPGLVFTNYWAVGARKELKIPEHVSSGYVDTSKVFPASIFCNPPSSWMVTKSVVADDGLFDEGLWTMEDIDLFARITRKYPAYFIKEPLMIKHVHSCKKGSVPDKYAEKTGERILEKWLPEMRRDRKFLVRFYCMMGKDMMRSGKKKKAIDYLWKAALLNPVNLKVVLKLARAYATRS